MSDYWDLTTGDVADDVNSYSSESSTVGMLRTPFDAKSCNYYQKGSSIIIETKAQYLDRVIHGHRPAGSPVAMLIPNDGYTLLSTYTLTEFDAALSNFTHKLYAFIGGLEDVNFVELDFGAGHPPATVAPESVDELTIGSDQVVHLRKKELSYPDYGTITWLHDYVFRFSEYKFHIQGNYYTVATHDVTLAAADATYDRIDTFYADSSPATSVLTGTPSANPIAPELDPLTQLFLQNVLVKAGSTAPDTITDEVIYDENTEWTSNTEAALYGATVDFADTTTPHHGTVQTRVTFAAYHFDHVIISYTNVVDVDISDSNLIIPIRTSRVFGATEGIYIRIKHTFTNVGTEVIIRDGKYGFDSSLTTFQEIIIPFADFKPTQNNINVLWIGFINGGAGVAGSTTIDFDYIRIQKGLAPISFTEVDPVFNEWLANYNPDWNATSGPEKIKNKPTIPAAQIQSDWTQASSGALDYIKNKPTVATPPKEVTGLTLTLTSWTLVSGFYEYDLSNANITATSVVDVIPDKADISIVKAADIMPETLSSSGSVKLYATNAPTGDIGVTIIITEVTV